MLSHPTTSVAPKKAVTPRHALLENLIEIVNKHVSDQFLDFSNRIVSALADGDLEGDVREIQARIRAGNLLRTNHYGYLSLLTKEIERALRREIAELAPGQKAKPRVAEQGLSLVPFEEMDSKVTLGSLAKPFEVLYSDALATLNVRLAFLLDRDILRVNQNPFRPEVFLGALQQAWLAFTADEESANLLLPLLKPDLFIQLSSMFDELNATLQRKAEQPGSVDSYKARKADSHDASSANPARKRKQQAELAQQLRQFFSVAQDPALDPELMIPDLPDIANLKAGAWAQGPAQGFQGGASNEVAQRAAQTTSKQPLLNYLAQVQQVAMPAGAVGQQPGPAMMFGAPGASMAAAALAPAGMAPAGFVPAGFVPGSFVPAAAMPAGGAVGGAAGMMGGAVGGAHGMPMAGAIGGAAGIPAGGVVNGTLASSGHAAGGFAGAGMAGQGAVAYPGFIAAPGVDHVSGTPGGFPSPHAGGGASPAAGFTAGVATGFVPAGAQGLLNLLNAAAGAAGLAGAGAGAAPGEPGAAATAPNVFYLPNIKKNAPQGSLTRADESTIDLLSAIFDTVFRDQNIPQEIRDLIRFLQIPVLKAALVDKDFFFQDAHPARRMIDLLSRMGWEQRKSPDDPMFQAMQRSVERVGRDHDHEMSVFSEAVNELEASIKAEEAAAATAIAEPIKAALKQEKMAEAGKSARNAVALRIGTGEVVAVVEAFLENKWVSVLTLAYSVDEEKPGAVKNATQTMDDLIWSVKPKITAEERKQLIGKLPKLLSTLNKWLDIIKWQDADRLQFFAELAECHASIVRAPLEVSPERQVEIAMEVARKAAERRLELEAQAAAKAPEPEPPLDDDAAIEVDTLSRGAWVEFDQDDGGVRKVKLAWISPLRTLYIFSTSSRQEAFSLSGDELAQRFRDGKARAFRTEGVVARALSQAIGEMAVNDASLDPPASAAA
ncbi:DUF1631 family protein [Pseudoduganella namucuonensis]|uniref:DUF1631 family protein n=1 Tax=Pseudoduganella namucuonensis TaxID=1035707 RepID=A0A1I7HRD0_9BURK|nr:DUF1631 family protein [Pseudoduganella namucuonensis]SFU62996.1 Protein of unknown function [Pseudoduganella namucuonensis]